MRLYCIVILKKIFLFVFLNRATEKPPWSLATPRRSLVTHYLTEVRSPMRLWQSHGVGKRSAMSRNNRSNAT